MPFKSRDERKIEIESSSSNVHSFKINSLSCRIFLGTFDLTLNPSNKACKVKLELKDQATLYWRLWTELKSRS